MAWKRTQRETVGRRELRTRTTLEVCLTALAILIEKDFENGC